MTTKAFIYNGVAWEELKVYNTTVEDERLDEQLDSGSLQVISDSINPFADYSMIMLKRTDNYLGEKETFYYGFDTVEKRMGNYYIHALELVEPTRALMGILIDGKAVTQPLDSNKKSLWAVLSGLFSTMQLQSTLQKNAFNYVTLNHSKYNENTMELLNNTISPEFYWQAQTTLWECLCDIGNVINCIPRLTANIEKTAFNCIYFEQINDIDKEYEI